jgi:hypothetical protein
VSLRETTLRQSPNLPFFHTGRQKEGVYTRRCVALLLASLIHSVREDTAHLGASTFRSHHRVHKALRQPQRHLWR